MEPVLLLKKFSEYARELKKLVEETKQAIKEQWNLYDSTTYLHLKESSMILSKLLARIIKIRYEIEELPEHELYTLKMLRDDEWNAKDPFDRAIHSAIDAVSGAQVLLDILDAKLSCIGEAYPEFVTYQCVNENCNLIPSRELSLTPKIDPLKEQTSNVDSEELETNGEKETAELNTSLESSPQSAGKGKLSRRKFQMKRFTGSGNDREFVSFWEEFQETVDQSPLSNEYKFAALRSLVRGKPYRLFLDLNYRSEGAYKEAWSRLFSEYADDELVRRNAERETNLRSLPAIVENQFVTSPEEWSDTYFFEKYCKSVPNYKTPDTQLVVDAIVMFLKFYTEGPAFLSIEGLSSEGPAFLSTEDLFSVWLILLHRACKSRNVDKSGASNIFGGEETKFFDLPKVGLGLLLKRFTSESKKSNVDTKSAAVVPWLLHWSESLTYNLFDIEPPSDLDPAKRREYWILEKNNYNLCYEMKVDYCAKYFALVSMVLFGIKFTSSESVEKLLNEWFDMISGPLCGSYDLPRLIPPHPDVYHFIKTSLFKPSSSAFQTYLTYLVGFYCEGDAWIKDFVGAGCYLPPIVRVSAGSIYWLENAAASVEMKPQEFLKFLLVDPSMQVSAVKIHKVLEKYKDQFTWRWARLFENYRLTELTVAENPELSYACAIFDLSRTENDYHKESCELFARFINDADPPSLTGENLGMFLRDILRTYSGPQME